MNRQVMNELLKWKNDPERKPLLLDGARQVGKTWLMKEFGAKYFQNVAYISFDKNKRVNSAFEDGYDIKNIISSLQIEVGFQIHPQNTLIVFDEVQELPQALTSLKYFCEDAREYTIVAGGSLLGVSKQVGTGFPVGKVDVIKVYPLTFSEFLDVTGNTPLLDLIYSKDWQMITVFKDKIAHLLRQYYFIGGMPEVVNSFLKYQDFKKVRHIQNRLLDDYRKDFGKHAPSDLITKIEMLWDSIPTQLAKENKRFIFSQVHKNLRAKDLELAILWLIDAGLIYNIPRVTKPALPLDAYRDDFFKVFFLDVGLLAAKSQLDQRTLLEGNKIFQEFKGALAEQYVQQELRAQLNISPYYWVSGNGGIEIDFLFQTAMTIVPLEVKAELNLKAKSLKSYCQKFKPPMAIRCSMSHYYKQDVPLLALAEQQTEEQHYTLLDMPLYGISQLLSETESDDS